MKKFFAVFLAVCIIPSFNAYAWVGGPFTNNSLTPEGDDGVYEAIAIPTTGNGIGMYRWGITNRNPGSIPFNTNNFRNSGNTANVQFGGQFGAFNQHTWYFNGATYYGPCFGSVNSGAGSLVTCVGNAGTALPSVNDNGSVAGPLLSTTVPTQVIGADGSVFGVGDFANSFFTARLNKHHGGGRNSNHSEVAARNFFGSGEIRFGLLNPATTPNDRPLRDTDGDGFGDRAGFGASVIQFDVFGSRVSLAVTG